MIGVIIFSTTCHFKPVCKEWLIFLLQVFPFFLAIANEVPVLAGVDVRVQLYKESFIELECAGELLHQLPNALQKLIHDRRNLLRVTVQVRVPEVCRRNICCVIPQGACEIHDDAMQTMCRFRLCDHI